MSPLGVPGDARHVVVTDSDEHGEEGHIIEDAETRIKMVQKRLFKKLPLIRQEIAQPILYGDDKPDIVIVGWGSTYGVMKEAVDALSPPHPPLIRGEKGVLPCCILARFIHSPPPPPSHIILIY